jgi:excinuclease ABC subunit C
MHISNELLQGIQIIKKFLSSATTRAGVYRMLDNTGKVLYVGKAKNLFNRLSSYTLINSLSKKTATMISKTSSLEIIVCETEKEALLLEASLIRSLKPKFNIHLKDDKSFPYILIRTDHEYGQILKHRGQKQKNGLYFGPFASANSVNKIVDYLQKIFLIRPCSDVFFASRKRPCIQYDIKKCSGPCTGKINKEDYDLNLKQAILFLQGKNKTIRETLIAKMNEASEKHLYEKAAEYRDRIVALNEVQSRQNIALNGEDCDYIAISCQETLCCIQIFMFRNGQNYGNKSYFPEQTEGHSDQEILEMFLLNFYKQVDCPKKVYVNVKLENKEILEEILTTTIIIPKSSAQKNIMNFVYDNTSNTLITHLAQGKKQENTFFAISQDLGTHTAIKRIDAFDNSHISGKFSVGAMIVCTAQGFSKKDYRLYNIKENFNGNDYEMMREVLTRRYKKMLLEYSEYTELAWPDLIIIDGGPGHLSTVQNLFKELNLNIPFICIAKGATRTGGNEKIYTHDNRILQLNNRDITLQFMQRLRDEVHRFAISSHRNKRSKENFSSTLTEIPNIGQTRRKNLMEHFGSVSAISQASIAELTQVKLISSKIAELIYSHFNRKS